MGASLSSTPESFAKQASTHRQYQTAGGHGRELSGKFFDAMVRDGLPSIRILKSSVSEDSPCTTLRLQCPTHLIVCCLAFPRPSALAVAGSDAASIEADGSVSEFREQIRQRYHDGIPERASQPAIGCKNQPNLGM